MHKNREKYLELNGDWHSDSVCGRIFLACFNRLIYDWYDNNGDTIDGRTDRGKEILNNLISESLLISSVAHELIYGFKVIFTCTASYYDEHVSAFRLGIKWIDKDEYIGMRRTSAVCTQPYAYINRGE